MYIHIRITHMYVYISGAAERIQKWWGYFVAGEARREILEWPRPFSR